MSKSNSARSARSSAGASAPARKPAGVLYFGKGSGGSGRSSAGGSVDQLGRLSVGSAVRQALVKGLRGSEANAVPVADRSVSVVCAGRTLSLVRGSVADCEPVALVNGAFVLLPPAVRKEWLGGSAVRLAPAPVAKASALGLPATAAVLATWSLPAPARPARARKPAPRKPAPRKSAPAPAPETAPEAPAPVAG